MTRKHLLLLMIMIIICGPAMADDIENATDAVRHMGIGWNLGNTLEANSGNGQQPTSDAYWGTQGLESETYWGQPTTTQALIKMMKDAGFGAIRVPVTWYNHMGKDGNINAAWMKRVHEVVDYVINEGLYCILNVHHDTGADGGNFVSWLKADKDVYAQRKARYEKLWTQIATEFKDYDGHLLFGGYNEMLDSYNSWCFASFSTPNKYDATVAASAYDAINSFGQSFVDAVRATGSNNRQRNLILNTYASGCGAGSWNSHLLDPLKEMKMPKGESNHIIFEVHSYPSISSLSGAKKELVQNIKDLKTYLAAKGGPVIFGEFGTSSNNGDGTNDYNNNRTNLFDFLTYFVQQTKANGMACFYWMGLTDGIYRSMPTFNQPDLAECLVKAYRGNTDGFSYPGPDTTSPTTVFEGEKALAWGSGITVPASAFSTYGEGVTMTVSFKVTGDGDDIQFLYGDWSPKPSCTIDGSSYQDYNPSAHGVTKGSSGTIDVTFPTNVYKQLTQKGLIMQGIGVTITKVVCHQVTTSITGPTIHNATTSHTDGSATAATPYYNMQGQRVATSRHGVYIHNGRKVIIR